jgi:hypothetical protein
MLRRRPGAFLLRLAGAVAIGACAAFAAPSLAAHPVGGQRYFSKFVSVSDTRVVLRVPHDGRHLSRSSYVSDYCGAARVRTARDAPVAIRRDGSFSFSKRGRRTFVSLTGRFVTRSTAIVKWHARFVSPFAGEGCDRVHSHTNRIYLGGLPEFHDCRTYQAKTLLETPTTRVFAQGGLLFGCLFADNVRVRLPSGASDVPDDISRVHAAGPFVAYAQFEFEGASCGSVFIHVVDLHAGTQLREEQESKTNNVADCGSPVTSLVLKSDGAVGWIVHSDIRGAPTEVHAVDSSGPRLLDSGTGIDVHSLSLDGSVMSWRNNGVTKTTSLT